MAITNTICPQRVLATAINHLCVYASTIKDPDGDAKCEDVDNCIEELEDISKALPSSMRVGNIDNEEAQA